MPMAPVRRMEVPGPRDFNRLNANEYDRSAIMAGILDLYREQDDNSNTNSSQMRHQRVFVRIYRTSIEHFAVLYPLRAMLSACKPLATVNLRACRVETVCQPDRPERFRISPRGTALTLSLEVPKKDTDLKEQWLNALTADAVSEAVLASSGRFSTKNQVKTSTIGRLLPVLDEEEEQCI